MQIRRITSVRWCIPPCSLLATRCLPARIISLLLSVVSLATPVTSKGASEETAPGTSQTPNSPSPISPPVQNPEEERTLQLQVFLDRAGFEPGKIDGKTGEFTRKALLIYEKAHGLEVDPTGESIHPGENQPALIEYTVTKEDENRIGRAPSKPQEQALQKWLPYRSVLELVSEKFHTTEAFLRTLNPQYTSHEPKAGDRLEVPNVEPFEIAAAEAKRTKEEPKEAKERVDGRWLDIDVAQKILEVKEGDQIVAAFPITPGSTTLPAPKGHWHVQTITYLPKFRYDKAMLFHGKRSASGIVTPPGPNNVVGVVWMNLNKKGIGIHGTDEPETIGRTTSHGCIRLANWDVVRVAALIQPGARVIIR